MIHRSDDAARRRGVRSLPGKPWLREACREKRETRSADRAGRSAGCARRAGPRGRGRHRAAARRSPRYRGEARWWGRGRADGDGPQTVWFVLRDRGAAGRRSRGGADLGVRISGSGSRAAAVRTASSATAGRPRLPRPDDGGDAVRRRAGVDPPPWRATAAVGGGPAATARPGPNAAGRAASGVERGSGRRRGVARGESASWQRNRGAGSRCRSHVERVEAIKSEPPERTIDRDERARRRLWNPAASRPDRAGAAAVDHYVWGRAAAVHSKS